MTHLWKEKKKNLKHTDGSKFFKPEEFITKNQIKLLFGKMWQQQRAGKLQVPKTTEQGQCDILKSAESNDFEDFDEIGEYRCC